MISFYIDYYKSKAVRQAAWDYDLDFLQSNERGKDGKNLYGFYEKTEYRGVINISSGWTVKEAYKVLKTAGDFSHIKNGSIIRCEK